MLSTGLEVHNYKTWNRASETKEEARSAAVHNYGRVLAVEGKKKEAKENLFEQWIVDIFMFSTWFTLPLTALWFHCIPVLPQQPYVEFEIWWECHVCVDFTDCHFGRMLKKKKGPTSLSALCGVMQSDKLRWNERLIRTEQAAGLSKATNSGLVYDADAAD